MKRVVVLVVSFWILVLALTGCSKPRETPSEVLQAFDELMSALDPDLPGSSYAALQRFASENSQYDIIATVESELKDRRQELEEAYLKGRDLAREEQFEEAETVLSDLAMHAQEVPAGESAREFLRFEFPFMRASRLLIRGDVEAAEKIAGELTGKQLTDEEMAKAQSLLDHISTAGVAKDMAHSASLWSAARMLRVHIDVHFAEWGQYPEDLDMDSPVIAQLNDNITFVRSVEAIEDYEVTRDGFSLIIIGKHSNARLRVTESGVEEISDY